MDLYKWRVKQMLIFTNGNCSMSLVYVDATKGWSNCKLNQDNMLTGGNFYNSYRWNYYNLWKF